jgi:hypothetical protein
MQDGREGRMLGDVGEEGQRYKGRGKLKAVGIQRVGIIDQGIGAPVLRKNSSCFELSELLTDHHRWCESKDFTWYYSYLIVRRCKRRQKSNCRCEAPLRGSLPFRVLEGNANLVKELTVRWCQANCMH